MSSWYVGTLIKNCELIRSRIFDIPEAGIISFTTVELDSVEHYALYSMDFDNFDYNNLLLVEKQIVSLIRTNQISESELEMLNAVSTGRTYLSLSKSLRVSRTTITKVFSEVCERISFYLGGVFTNSGYLEYIGNKYDLTLEQLAQAEIFMNKEI